MKIIEGPNSFTAITCDMLPYDKLHARAAVAHYFNKKFIEVFDEVHLEDVASLIVALEGFLVGYKSVIEQHPEEKQAYIELSNKMTT
ncbi:MAG: hypothetical protein IJX42_08110, partial [Oscillospiraceae bacterium]|nr:hypothetical protein [Oscillospiraceae bacterium]